MLAVMAASAAATTTVSVQSANKQAEATTDSANKAAASDYVQQTEQQDQVNQQAAQEKLQRTQAAMADRARLRVSAGESGVGGLSPAKDIAETYMNQGMDASILETNRANKIRQIQLEKGATYANNQGRDNIAAAGKSAGWSAGLQIGSSALQGGSSGYTMSKGWNK